MDLLAHAPNEKIRKMQQKIIVERMLASRTSSRNDLQSHQRLKAQDLQFLTKSEKTYVFLNGCLAFRETVYKKVLASILVVALFVERYCFLTMVYKTRCTNYCLLICVVFINTLLLLVGKWRRGRKAQTRMHELFALEQVA